MVRWKEHKIVISALVAAADTMARVQCKYVHQILGGCWRCRPQSSELTTAETTGCPTLITGLTVILSIRCILVAHAAAATQAKSDTTSTTSTPAPNWQARSSSD